MELKKLDTFISRMEKLGIYLGLTSNYPWIYIDNINGKRVTERFYSNHGFTIAFFPRKDEPMRFTDLREIFRLIRKYR